MAVAAGAAGLALTTPTAQATPEAGAAPESQAAPVPRAPAPQASAPRFATEETTTLTGADIKRVKLARAPVPAWKTALEYAMDKRGTPYVWGGTGERGYDCSGLMLRAYERAGIELPRTAREQYRAYAKKVAWKDLQPGDLVFFSGLGHVGMISRPGHMVHSPRTGDVVKEEKLSAWRRSAFVGAVRPDPEGVRRWSELLEQRTEPAPATPTASML